jgi:cellulose synthase/poly-beta-1,6-N-acetylglucosamine synthase-like glycosyltransferase
VVSINLSVYNEEEVIRDKIENFLALDYPRDLLEFLVVSDGCEDRTEDIVSSFAQADSRIRLLVQDQRGGKTSALNRGIVEARGEILVFTDANSMFDHDAVRKLVRHFSDQSVGLVSGRSIYLDSFDQAEQVGGGYRAYEEWLKEQESLTGSIAGADGAIYAMRRNLYEPLLPEQINDFIHPVQVVLKGYRAVSDPEALCREVVDEEYGDELRRQTRIMAQSWLIYLSQIGPLLGRARFWYAWQLTSHKFLRWLTLPLMTVLFAATILSLPKSSFYMAAMVLQIIFVLLAGLGWSRRGGGAARIAYLFMVLHLAAVKGFFNYLSGNSFTVWNPRNN